MTWACWIIRVLKPQPGQTGVPSPVSSEGLVFEPPLKLCSRGRFTHRFFLLQNETSWPKPIPAVALLVCTVTSEEKLAHIRKSVSPSNYLPNDAKRKAWEGRGSKPSQAFSPACERLLDMCCPASKLMFSPSLPAPLADTRSALGIFCSTDTAWGARASTHNWRCLVLFHVCLCFLITCFSRETGYVVPNWMWGEKINTWAERKIIVLIHLSALVCSV